MDSDQCYNSVSVVTPPGPWLPQRPLKPHNAMKPRSPEPDPSYASDPAESTAPRPGGELPVTRMLLDWRQGDAQALEKLTPVVYDELRRLARSFMRGERAGHVLQTTALVHEAYIKLVDLELHWKDRVHFYSVAARLMRRVLVDFARERNAEKRGGGVAPLALDEALVGAERNLDLIALDQALEQLGRIDERKVKVVEMRSFAGLTIEEVAEVLDISHATVERDLSFARAFLTRRLTEAAG